MGLITSFYDHIDNEGGEGVNAHIHEEFNVLLSLSCIYMKLDRKNRFRNTIYCIVMYMLLTYHLVQFAVTSYLAKNELVNLALPLLITIIYLFAITMITYLIGSRRYWNRFVRRCIRNFFTYKYEVATADVNRLRAKGRRERYLILVSGTISVGVCIIATLFLAPLLDKYSSVEISVKNLPKSINLDLPVPAWFPFQTEGKMITFILSAVQIIAALPISVIIPATLSSFIFFVQQITVQIELLMHSIERLEKRALRLMKIFYPDVKVEMLTIRSPLFQHCIKESLTENIKHQHEIILGLRETLLVVSQPVYVGLFLVTFVLAVSLTGMISPSASLGFRFVSVILLVAELASLALCHYYAQKLIDLSNEFSEKLYNTRWTSYNTSIRKMLIIMFERSKKTFKISPLGLSSVINWENFSRICNTAYTYTNLMLALEK